MKKCPYCAEEIQDEAVKCKHCQAMLDKGQLDKWFFKTSVLIIGFLCVGPLVLPLVWFNPRFSKKVKIIISVIAVILSYYSGVLVMKSLNSISQYYKQMF